jgi:type I restriction enzyme, S subunit
MSEANNFLELRLGEICKPTQWPSLSQTQLTPNGYKVYGANGIIGRYSKYTHEAPTVAITCRGSTCGEIHLTEPYAYITSNAMALDNLNEEVVTPRYIANFLVNHGLKVCITGSAQPQIIGSALKEVVLRLPPLEDQNLISNILGTLDTQICQTEAIIAKLQQVKQGLLHDLLTRGIDANGQLRPPRDQAPELYKESPLGWIPRDWEVTAVDDLAESLIDGPFGSNLKTEHYVENNGIRVARLQNIQVGAYDDRERAFISYIHAHSLQKNEVHGGDLLIASLGDQNHPVGRACLYPHNLPKAINKADCFRLRSNQLCTNEFLMHAFNGHAARRQVRGFEQGVTLKRINTRNLRKLKIGIPPRAEQAMICERYKSLEVQLKHLSDEREKLGKQKTGLMDDLLTGRVRVTPLLDTANAS